MKQSDNTQPEVIQESVEKAAKKYSDFGLYTMTDSAYDKYLSFISGANWQKKSLIQTIENRVRELEQDPMDIITKTVKIEELKNLLTTLKS